MPKLMPPEPSHQVSILTGPTASGKSSLAIELTETLCEDIEIVNADSMLVYRGMDIGTAKPTRAELQKIPHHLIDIRNPDEPFTAGEFYRLANEAIADIHRRGKKALVVGGTGFYLKALLFGLWKALPSDPSLRKELETQSPTSLFEALQKADPISAKRIGIHDTYRLIRSIEILQLTGKTPTQLQAETPSEPDPRYELWILDRKNEDLFERIHLRTEQMLREGWIEEYRAIETQFPGCRPLSAVGYAQIGAYLRGELPSGRKIKPGIAGLVDEISLATRQLVKSQRTWFKNQAQRVRHSRWFCMDEDKNALKELVQRWML